MRKYLLALSGICLTLSLAFAQKENHLYENLPADSLTTDVGMIRKARMPMGSLLNSWHVQYFTKSEDFCEDAESNVFSGLCLFRSPSAIAANDSYGL